MSFIHYEFDTRSPNAVIGVEIDKQANVMLLDPINFSNYRSGHKFRYQDHGGYYRESPVFLHPPHTGHWHVVIDLAGGSGTIYHRAWVRQ